MKSACLFISLYIVTGYQPAIAQVPHQFEANTPALASEVNENFAHVINAIATVESNQNINTLSIQSSNSQLTTLTNRTTAVESIANGNTVAIISNEVNIDSHTTSIQNINTQLTNVESRIDSNESDIQAVETDVSTLETQVSNLMGSSSATIDALTGTYHNTISYSAKTAATGSDISNNGLTLRIVEFPFKELGSGDKYTVKFARVCGASCSDPELITLTTQHVKSTTSGTTTIDGYPAHIKHPVETHTFRGYSNTSNSSYAELTTSTVYIRVAETLLSISYTLNRAFPTGNAAGTSDFTAVFDLDQVAEAANVIQHIDDAIDYIDIEPIL